MEIIIFARYWEPGRVKTRLCPPLTADEAAQLNRLCLDALVARLRGLDGFTVTIAYEPEAARAFFAARYPGVALAPQQGAELGEKLFALAAARTAPCLFTGSDCPTTPLLFFRQAAQALSEGADAVFCPTEDGGTCILGAQPQHAAWYRDIPWSSGRENRVLAEKARARQWRLAELELWHDLDRPTDVPRTVRELLDERKYISEDEVIFLSTLDQRVARWLEEQKKGAA